MTAPRMAALVLAGGRSTRFGAEKATAQWEGTPLLLRVAAALAPGSAAVAVNAPEGSGAAALARAHGLACIPDPAGAPRGPLAGVLAGLRWLEGGAGDLLLTAPCDTPRLPGDLAARLLTSLAPGCAAVYAEAPDGPHYLCTLWRPQAADAIAQALAGGDHPPVRQVLAALGAARGAFPDARTFANVNTTADLAGLAP